jgi:tetratricopeptide (TPR) repeat protein
LLIVNCSPAPCSLLPTPCSLFPTPCSLFLIKTLNPQEIKSLLIKGKRAFNRDNYQEAVAVFEQLYREVDAKAANYFDIQRKLAKAYQANQQIEEAIALCEEIIATPVEAYQIWGRQFLTTITEQITEQITGQITEQFIDSVEPFLRQSKEQTENKSKIFIPLRQKSLPEFKNYCQENLLPSLKQFEQQRKYAIASIFISGIIVFAILLVGTKLIAYGVGIEIFVILIIFWIFFCQGCLYASRIGFKREIIDKIVQFIDEHKTLNYAHQLLIESNRNTTLNFTESQLFQQGIIEPDYLKQEDCVYGTIENIDIFFSEIIAQNTASWYRLNEKKTVFRGLFFVAKFPKNFKSRAFILPQIFKHQVPKIEEWRGELINLEDSEFNSYFRVYSYDQIEARFILSTSLIARLVNFRKQVKRNFYVSFIDGHIFIAIPYHKNLFEPQLFKSMLSFAPLREYFEILQFMIGIVRELHLNQTIWW